MASNSTDDKQSYEFVREKIKERPLNKKRLLRRTILTAVFALLFGFIACLTFFVLEPVFSNWLSPAEQADEEAVPIVFDETQVDELLPEELLFSDADAASDDESGAHTPAGDDANRTDAGPDSQPELSVPVTPTTPPEGAAEELPSEGSTPEATPTPDDYTGTPDGTLGLETSEEDVTESLPPFSLSVEDYEGLYDDLSIIADNSMKSMVSITYVTSGLDLFQESFDRSSTISGVIVANNGVSLLILSKLLPAATGKTCYVSFYDGSVIQTSMLGTDSQTGICIYEVPLTEISDSTMNTISIANLGSSATGASFGRPVIALGSPTGSTSSMAYGIITSDTGLLRKEDASYKLITTDIYGSRNASGILINYSGEVIGLIDNSYNSSDMANQIGAIGITEIKRVIEALSNGKSRARLGIYGTDISFSMAQSLSMPRGVFVNRFELDSPAMKGGIQASDVITGIDDSPIRTMTELTNTLSRYQPGDTITITLERQVRLSFRELKINVTLDELN